ncbi:PREDICTED: protein transport protein Sec24-like At3g07100 [Camelina sativa]|uniref:Protein transport protein Sec24-like At3g07100 n=1 Tax=Camelina sativa TaxID=90675 RepID=A0ABM0W1B1_CAMSA|nr:PREDICTED: protein transport protein Sec24-like At3g07100 [Camelina sativa]XP_010464295.1 PREDICTED: protein transport protein Sec24-like At3g07100 [Camelina sativa]
MGTENKGYPNFPARPAPSSSPFASAPPPGIPPQSGGPPTGSDAVGFRPFPPSASQPIRPFTPSGPPPAPTVGGMRPAQPSPFVSQIPGSRPPPPSSNSFPSTAYGPPPPPPGATPFQRFPSPPFPTTQNPPPQGPPQTLAGHFSPPMSLRPQQQPMGPPAQTMTSGLPGANTSPSPADFNMAARPGFQQSMPPVTQSYPGVGGLQPSFPGYPSKQVSQPPPMPFQGPPGPPPVSSYPPQIGGFAQRPNLAAQQNLHPSYAPPTSNVQGLVEDFNSLSLASIPGSMEPGLDHRAFPRPLDGDVEPNSFADMYPMNCHSRYLRLTTSAIPNSQSLASRWHLPLGAVVCPLAETPKGEEVPLIDFGSTGIIRCRRCRTYVNPYVTFTDSGRKWRCNICSMLNDVPGEYFSHLDANGRRMDMDQRPELTKGSVEIIAPTEYMVRPPMPPIYFFLIDVSISATKSGMLEVVAQTIKSCLDNLPGYPRTQIGFITYDSTLHFYNMKSSLSQPQMMIVTDLDDIFLPLPDDLLVNLSESRTVVEAFLDSLPMMFQDNVNVESAFGPALRAAFMVMNQLGGKLLIFQNSLPSLGAGRLKLRGDDPRVYGTDKEYALRVAEDPFYKQMAADCTKFQIGINVYAFSDKYTDIASLGTLAKYTGGQVYYYPGFQSSVHGDKLRHELARDLTRETAWEAVMRIRCGKGIRFSSYHGNFMLRSTDLIALPAVDCDKAYAMQLSLEETLLTTQTVYFQVALLYTASCGERRIRVHTSIAPVVADLGEMYRQADTGSIVSLYARLAIEKSLSAKLDDARNAIQQKIVKALKEYRNLHAVQHRLGSRLIYPETLKFLPLYGMAIIKSTPLQGGPADASLDERCAAGFTMMALPVKKLLKLLYPNLFRVDEWLLKPSADHDDLNNVLKRLPLAAESLDSRGLYIYDDGFRLVLWFGRMLSPDIAKNLLGADFAAELSRVTFQEQGNGMSKKLMSLVKKLRENDPSYHPMCFLVRQGEQPREGFLLLRNLIEDQMGGSSGYVDWILQIQRQIQQN